MGDRPRRQALRRRQIDTLEFRLGFQPALPRPGTVQRMLDRRRGGLGGRRPFGRKQVSGKGTQECHATRLPHSNFGLQEQRPGGRDGRQSPAVARVDDQPFLHALDQPVHAHLEPQFDVPHAGIRGRLDRRSHFNPFQEKKHQIALLFGRQGRHQFAKPGKRAADPLRVERALFAGGQILPRLLALHEESLLLLVQGRGLLPQFVSEKINAAARDGLRAVPELLGQVGERLIQFGQLRAQGSPLRLRPALGLQGSRAQHIGVAAAFREKADDGGFEGGG